jgi:DNA-binding HxlR family transcriptional regulator
MDLRRPPGGHYPGGTVKGYGQFCPVAKAAEIVAERWTPLVLRELLCGSRRFGDLHRGVPLMSRTLLAARLAQLEDAGVVRSVPRPRGRGREYHLTAAGQELRPLIECLGAWGQRWARAQVGRGDLDAGLLMWDIHRRLNVDALPPARVVVRFDFRGVPATMRGPRTWWLVLERRAVDLCLKDPGFLVDLVVSAELRALTQVWMGDVPLAETVRAGLVRLDGPPSLVPAFPTWLMLSTFAGVERVGARPRPARGDVPLEASASAPAARDEPRWSPAPRGRTARV